MDILQTPHLIHIEALSKHFFTFKITKMRSENILKSDLLDIVFENRNKTYGAYELRRHYKRRLVKALLVAFVFAGGMAAFVSFVTEEKVLVSGIFTFDDPETVKIKEVEPEVKKPELPKKQESPKAEAAPKAAAQQLTNIDIVRDDIPVSKILTLPEDVAIAGKNSDGKPLGQVFVPEPTKIDGEGHDIPLAPKVDKETPTLSPDIMPAYPGGVAALRKFLEKNLKSFDDIESGQVVSVKITFVVGYDGKLKGFQVLEDGGDVYNKEVIRVLKKMPEWIPGKAHGENVSVYYTIPVKFTTAE